MQQVLESALERKLASFVKLSPPELDSLRSIQGTARRLRPGTDIVREGDEQSGAYVVARGWVASYKMLADGGRQVIDFQLPGDFIGMRGMLLQVADHSFEPVTETEVTLISKQRLAGVLRDSPRVATALLWAASRDEARLVEHLVDIGRRDGMTRTAHLLLELGSRLKHVGLGTDEGYDCPLTQYFLSDALGLSAIHVNRCLRRLRQAGLLSMKGGRVTFHDLPALVELADFDIGYLAHGGPLI